MFVLPMWTCVDYMKTPPWISYTTWRNIRTKEAHLGQRLKLFSIKTNYYDDFHKTREREGARESFTKILLKRPGFWHQADLIRSSNSYVCLPCCLEEPFIIPTCPIKTFVHTELRANMRWRLHACPRSCTSALLLLERLYTTSAHGSRLFPERISLRCMKTRINIQRQSIRSLHFTTTSWQAVYKKPHILLRTYDFLVLLCHFCEKVVSLH